MAFTLRMDKAVCALVAVNRCWPYEHPCSYLPQLQVQAGRLLVPAGITVGMHQLLCNPVGCCSMTAGLALACSFVGSLLQNTHRLEPAGHVFLDSAASV